jgi:L-asparaginase
MPLHRSALLAILAIPTALHAAQQDRQLPNILVITTGGTIASRQGAPTIEGQALVEAVPELLEHADIEVEEFSRIGSSQMTPDRWLRLSQRINELFASRTDLTGIVVTHGTDTMEETGYFLNLTVRDTRPVVLVGSMRSANQISADGPANLLDAVRVAAHPDAVDHGVLLVLNNEINAARDAWKTNNLHVQAFQTPELGLLGVADPDTVVFYRRGLRRHTARSEFVVDGLETLPDIELISDYAGFDGATVDFWVDRGVDGLVVATFAGGRMSAGARQSIDRAVANDIPVVIASRVPGGRISGLPLVEGTVLARDLSPHKARVLLMVALTRTRDVEGIRRMYGEY